jgi:hypothetical protein
MIEVCNRHGYRATTTRELVALVLEMNGGKRTLLVNARSGGGRKRKAAGIDRAAASASVAAQPIATS